jgi:hypothetical protein
VLAVSALSFDTGFAIDADHQLLSFYQSGSEGVYRAPPTLAVSGRNIDRAFAIDENRELWKFHYEEIQAPWTKVMSAPAIVLAVSAVDDKSGFAIDGSHRLWSFSDDQWTQVPNAPAVVLAVSACAAQAGYAIDDKHQLWRFDQDQWSLVPGAPTAVAATQVAAVETGAITTDAQGTVTGTLERAYTVLDSNGNVSMIPFSVGELTTEFVGDMMIASHLIGYIEGAAPVPSVNMTNPGGGYNSMTSVTYSESHTTVRRWASSRNVGIDATVDARRAWFVNKLSAKYSWLAQEQVTTSDTLAVNSQCTIMGAFDTKLGQYVAANQGVALVNVASAKIFALRLASDQNTLVGYRYVANPAASGVMDVSFMMDPAYVQCGQLESYMRDSLADDLEVEIMREQRAREAYYLQYDANAFSQLPTLAEVSQTQFMARYSWSTREFSQRGTDVRRQPRLGHRRQL